MALALVGGAGIFSLGLGVYLLFSVGFVRWCFWLGIDVYLGGIGLHFLFCFLLLGFFLSYGVLCNLSVVRVVSGGGCCSCVVVLGGWLFSLLGVWVMFFWCWF